MSPNQVARSSFWKDYILTQDRPSQECSPLPHIRSKQLPGSIFFTDLSTFVSPDSILWGRINLCTTFRVPKSSSFVDDSLTRSVTSSIKLAWRCGHRECLSTFQTVPKFGISMLFPFPIFNSILLFERGTLITSGIFSSVRPRLGLSHPQGQSQLSSLSKTSTALSLHNSCGLSRPLNPRKGCMLSPLLQTHIDNPFVGFRVIFTGG